MNNENSVNQEVSEIEINDSDLLLLPEDGFDYLDLRLEKPRAIT